MALAKGNVTNNSGSGTSISFSHTQNTGSDLLLFVAIYTRDTANLTNIQYGGNSMTLITSYTYAADSAKVSFYKLLAPPTGANNITGTVSVGDTWVTTAFSLTGCSDVGNFANTGLQNTPNSQTLTVSANSFIFCGGTSKFSFDSLAAITIDGNSTGEPSCDVTGVAYLSQCRGELEPTALSAGSITCITDTIADTFQASNHRVEFLEAGAGPTTRRRIIIT